MSETAKFESWAIVEIMGHQRYAGWLSEQAIGGCNFVRIDVPEKPAKADGSGGRAPFTKLFGQASIFCITPVSEATARAAAEHCQAEPVYVFDAYGHQRALPGGDWDDDQDSEII